MSIDTKPYEEDVKHPGKFQGQEPWVPYFWKFVCNGYGEESIWQGDDVENQEFILFEPFANEMESFGMGNEPLWVVVWEDSQGFVRGRTFPDRKAAEDWAQST